MKNIHLTPEPRTDLVQAMLKKPLEAKMFIGGSGARRPAVSG